MIGTTLGPYRIDRELGTGGMGTVYEAVVVDRAPGLAPGTKVALKVLHPHLLETPGTFKRFLREAEIGKSVVHDNVVRTFDCDSLSTAGKRTDFLVMEYVEGQTLRGLLRELERVPEELCRHIGREVSRGLAAIHAAGAVHCDVKPENVLITGDHVVKVMDLGIARLSDEALRLSQTGGFIGSVPYAAPEYLSGGGSRVDGRADLYALGLMLYELSCGTNPYLGGDGVAQIMHRVLHEEPRRLGDVNPQLSPFFEEMVHRLMAKKPEERFADAKTLFGVLEEGERSEWWRSRAQAIRAVTHRPVRRIRIPRETAVYGREGEIARLRALYAMAKAGEGQVVVIEGEAGIGKSRVVDELVGRLRHDGEDFNFLFGSYPPGVPSSAAGAFATAFREQLGETDLAEGLRDRLGPAGTLAPAFAALLLGSAMPTGAEPLTRDSLQTCFVSATRSLAAESTTILLIDDLHFATDDSRALFTSLAMAVPGHRVLLIGTMRPGADGKWLAGLARLPDFSQMTLPRLGPKELVRLLEDAFRSSALASSLGVQIALKSDGNPFFAFELIRGLREGQFITQKEDGTWVSTRAIADIQIPSSVLELVNARVGDLSQEERDLLDVASCWGFEFDPLLVGEVVGLARIPLLKLLSLIERKHRLVRSAGPRFVFDHHQVQEALYRGLPELLRESYHGALASALETRAKCADMDPATLDGTLCVDLCEHFLKGGQGERAARYLGAAQTHLEKGYRNDAATLLAERALAVPGLLAGLERARTLLRLCAVLDRLGRRERQEEAAREAERLTTEAADEGLRGQAASALGRVLWVRSRYREAEASFRLAQEIARARADARGEASAENGLGIIFDLEGRYGEAREHYERGIAIHRRIGNRQGEAGATINLGTAVEHEGHLGEAREHYERGIAICREIGDRPFEANATGNLGLVFHYEGRFREAREHHESSLAIYREIGNRTGEAGAIGNLGLAYLAEGRLARAREQCERALAIHREIGEQRGEGYAIQTLGRLADEEGDAAAALRWTEEALALRRKIGHGSGVVGSLLTLADLRRRAGDVDGARTALNEALSLSREQKNAPRLALALAMLACLPGGDAPAALAALATIGKDGAATQVRWLLWQATADPAHLTAAKGLLEDLLAKNSDHRESMLAHVRLHREIAAAQAEGS